MTVLKQINCGNSYPVTGWESDASTLTSGSQVYNDDGTPVAQDTSGVDCPEEVLQDHRWALSGEDPLAYSIGGLGAYSTVDVTLYWSEIFYDASGLRRFNVDIQGVNKETNYDVWVQAGNADNTGVSETYTVAPSAGTVTIEVFRVTAAPMLSGIKVVGDDPPSVSITSPSDAATVSGTVTIEATATDDDAVTGVEFFIDDASIGADSTPSGSTYAISWDTTLYSNASHTIKATATDSGAQTTDDTVSVTVNNAVASTKTNFDEWEFAVDTGAGLVAMETGSVPDLVDGVDINRGFQDGGYDDRVARVGVLTGWLNNSGQKYSPGHANALSGFEVGAECRFRVKVDGTWRTRFRGVMDIIRPDYGIYGRKVTYIRAVDDMDRLDRATVGAQVIHAFWRTGEGIEELLDNVYTPPAKAISAGQAQLDYIGFQSSDTVRSAITKLVNSEGYPATFHFRADGTAVFEDNTARRRITETAWTVSNAMSGLTVVRQRRDLYSLVRVVVHPSTTNPGFEVVGSLSGSDVPMIAPGETRVLTINYRDPADPLTKQFLATNVQDLVKGTDINLASAASGGDDLYASCTIVHKKGANSSEVSITNNGTRNVYVQKLSMRGQGVRMYENQTLQEEASAPVEAALELDFGFNANLNEATGLAQRAARRVETSRGKVTDLYVKPRNPTLLGMILGAEISDRVALTETQTAVDDLYLINAMRERYAPGGYCEAHYELEPETDNPAWLLGVVGRSELGATTYLG